MEFEDFSVDEAALELRRHGGRVDLSPQGVRLLIALLQRRGELVTRQELYRILWPGDPDVDVDRGLNTLMRQLRRALGDRPSDPRFIKTYPRRGYRMLPPPAGGRAVERPRRSLVELALPRLAWVLLFTGVVAAAFLWPPRHDPDASVPEPARESFRLGRHLLLSPTLARRAEAVPLLTDAVRLAPKSARARAHLADALLWAGRPADAERESARALALDEDEPHALFIGGVLALIRGWDWPRAEALLRRSIDRDPGSAVYHVVLGLVLSTAGKSAEALSLLDWARELDPASAVLTADVGMMYLYVGQPRKAAEACEQAARLAPDALYTHDCALAARSLLGDFRAARSHAATMVRLVGYDEHEVLGDTSEPPDAAVARYHQWDAARAEADSTGWAFGSALAFVQAGRHAEALEALSRAAARREMGFVTATVDPRLASLHSDARFLRMTEPLVAKGAAHPAPGAGPG